MPFTSLTELKLKVAKVAKDNAGSSNRSGCRRCDGRRTSVGVWRVASAAKDGRATAESCSSKSVFVFPYILGRYYHSVRYMLFYTVMLHIEVKGSIRRRLL